MRRWLPVCALIAAATPAQAGEKVLTTPIPGWVVPVAAPAAPPAKGDAPVTLLLSDQQVRFERGSVTTYNHVLVRIDTAQGLGVGNLSLPWRPDVGDLTVHRLQIRRGERVIDVLAAGQTFTVLRREQNLESAMFDGVLTATIQPEGLQVGDVIDMATSVSERDPVLAGHVEHAAILGGPLPIGRAHWRASWPAGVPLGLRATNVTLPKVARQGDTSSVELTLDSLQPAVLPKLAPARYRIGRLVEASDFASWADLGTLMAPLYAKAAVLPASGPLTGEVARIRAASADPKARAQAALTLVQDRVRYVALAMGAGGYVPADAATTWARRYGDCKAKTALLLAILHALDIAAEPVAANALAGDGVDARLPEIAAFNHVLVRATVAGRAYWLDGTRTGDTALDRIATPGFGWGLPLVPRGAALVTMVPSPPARPLSDTDIAIDATGGLTTAAPVTVVQTYRGDAAIGLNAALGNLVGDARERALREMWKRQYDMIEAEKMGVAFDPAAGELRLTLDGKAKMDWSSGWYETDGLGLGYRADFAREPGPDRDAPFAVEYPAYSRVVETIRLPATFADTLALDKVAIDRTVGGVEYHRRGGIDRRVFRVEATQRSVVPEFPAKDAPAAQAALREMANATLYIPRPASYAMTDAELKVADGAAPTGIKELLQRGYARADHGRLDDALADFTAALRIDPTNGDALANRALMYAWKHDGAAAARDVAGARAANSRNKVTEHADALLAEQRGDYAAAARYYAAALAIDPQDQFALTRRVGALRAAGQADAARPDIDAAAQVPREATLRATVATPPVSPLRKRCCQ